MFRAIWAAVIGGNPLSWVALGLCAVMLLGAAFGLGAWQGASICVTAQAKVTASAVPAATAAQAAQDGRDYLEGLEDGKALGAAAQTAKDSAAFQKARAAASVKPIAPGCPPQVIPATVMQGLNDPKIIGDVP